MAQAKRQDRRGTYDRRQTAKARRSDQRNRLLAAAGLVFAKVGLAEASVEAIVKEAGMSRRTFYEHFDGLRDALLELHDQAATMAYMLIEAQAKQHADPVQQLEAGLRAFLTLVGSSGGLARVLFTHTPTDPELRARHAVVLARFAELLFRGAHDAYKAGHGTRQPDQVTIYTLIAGIEGLARRYLERNEEHRAVEAVPALVELVYRAFK